VALSHVPIDRITETDLRELIAGQAPESLYIEYKRQTYGGKDADRREFLADLSSFANSRGGDLLIGVSAADGVPVSLCPFTDNADAEQLRLESMARTGLEPRIPNLQMRIVPVAPSGSVLVIRVPRSYRLPHRVIFGGANRFWARSSAGKYEPNVEELRSLFVFAPELAERMRVFRFDRVASVVAGDTPVPLMSDCGLALHVVPFAHFDVGASLLVEAVIEKRLGIPPLGTDFPHDSRVNVDGVVMLSNPDAVGGYRAYTQVFRAGAFEAVDSSILHSSGHIDIHTLDYSIVHHSCVYARVLHQLGVEPPYAVMVSLFGLRGRMLSAWNLNFGQFQGQTIARDQLHLAEVILETAPPDDRAAAHLLRPILDQLANASGRRASISFDQHGNWAP
jgi:hypothetical protein